MKVKEIWQRLQDEPFDRYYFLTEDKKPVKVGKIPKTHYAGKIYGVDVPNDIILARRNGKLSCSVAGSIGAGNISYNITSGNYERMSATDDKFCQRAFIRPGCEGCGHR